MEWRRWWYAAQALVRGLVRSAQADRELDDEISFHLAVQTQENVRRGMNDAERRRARGGDLFSGNSPTGAALHRR
jgi:hypothetical protein